MKHILTIMLDTDNPHNIEIASSGGADDPWEALWLATEATAVLIEVLRVKGKTEHEGVSVEEYVLRCIHEGVMRYNVQTVTKGN